MKIHLRSKKLPILQSARLTLREINLHDITNEYIAWLNCPITTQFLEIRFVPQTRERVEQYVEDHHNDINSSMHFGVYYSLENKETLIGTTTLNDIRWQHRTANISFVIGHPFAQRKGFATESVHAVCAYIFTVHNFQKVCGGFYKNNIGSQKVFDNNYFETEGILKEQSIDSHGIRTDSILRGILQRNFKKLPKLLGDAGEIIIYGPEQL